jgi:peptidoglycan/xylan/chitin deacetylase (PgdA/CDA1 family)
MFLYCTPAETRRELARAQEAIADVTGVRPAIARPPYGVRTPAYFRAASALGLQTIQWSATGYDWKRRPAARIAASVLARAEAGGIVLLHDGAAGTTQGREETVRSLPLIVKGMAERALRFVRVSDLLAAHPEDQRLHA